MTRKATKASQKPPKKRPLYTPEPVRERVLTLHMSGQSNRQIANAEKIDRETVGRILSQEEVLRIKAQARSQLLRLVPKAIGVFEEALDSEDVRVRIVAGTKLLDAVGTLQEATDQPAAPKMHWERKGGGQEAEDRTLPLLDWKEHPGAYLGEVLDKLFDGRNLTYLHPVVRRWLIETLQGGLRGPRNYLGTTLGGLLAGNEPTSISPQALDWLRDELRSRLPEAAIERIREAVPEAAILLPPPAEEPA